jgi:hypothetical protein
LIGEINSTYDYLYDLQQNSSYVGGSRLSWDVSDSDGDVQVLSATSHISQASIVGYYQFTSDSDIDESEVLTSFVDAINSTVAYYNGGSEGIQVKTDDFYISSDNDYNIEYSIICDNNEISCESVSDLLYNTSIHPSIYGF